MFSKCQICKQAKFAQLFPNLKMGTKKYVENRQNKTVNKE